ncbi:hypothetical protein D9M73_191720 [compost metagenome]
MAAQGGDVGDVGALVHQVFERHFERGDFGKAGSDFGAGLVLGVHRQGDGRQDADDGDHDHQFDQREAFLTFH